MESQEYFCEHIELDAGFCTCCGLQVENDIYVTTVEKMYSKTCVYNKFTIKNETFLLKKQIETVLSNLNLIKYTNSVISTIKETKFNHKLSTNDKILLISYYICKTNFEPVTVKDFVKFSALPEHKFLKSYRDSFTFQKNNTEYFRNIFLRAKEFVLQEYNVQSNVELNQFLEAVSKFQSQNKMKLAVCVALLHTEDNLCVKAKQYLRKCKQIANKIKNMHL